MIKWKEIREEELPHLRQFLKLYRPPDFAWIDWQEDGEGLLKYAVGSETRYMECDRILMSGLKLLQKKEED